MATNLLTNWQYSGKVYTPKGEMALILPELWEMGCLDNGNLWHYTPTGGVITGKYDKYGPRKVTGMAPCLKPEVLKIDAVAPYLDPPRIPDGYAHAVTGFKLYGTICYWMAQTVPATPGNIYRLVSTAHAWAHAPEDPDGAKYTHGIGYGPYYAEDGEPLTNDQLNYEFKLGIDPYGSLNPFGSAVKWGKAAYIYNSYYSVPAVEAEALYDYITIFLFTANRWGWTNSNSYWGPASLEDLGIKQVDYVVVVNLLPQDATKAEKLAVLDTVHDSRQTILQSADDAKKLVQPGMAGSKVVVWDAARWTGGDIVSWLAPCVVETKTLPK